MELLDNIHKTIKSALFEQIKPGLKLSVAGFSMTDVYCNAGEYSKDMLTNLESNIKSDCTEWNGSKKIGKLNNSSGKMIL